MYIITLYFVCIFIIMKIIDMCNRQHLQSVCKKRVSLNKQSDWKLGFIGLTQLYLFERKHSAVDWYGTKFISVDVYISTGVLDSFDPATILLRHTGIVIQVTLYSVHLSVSKLLTHSNVFRNKIRGQTTLWESKLWDSILYQFKMYLLVNL